jgi:putative oxidoreductase
MNATHAAPTLAPAGPHLSHRSVVRWLLHTDDAVAPLIARVALGIVMFPHGAQKLLGWFGGEGPGATIQMMRVHMGIPPAFALLAIIAEFFGALGVFTGFLTRVAAFGIACVMLVAFVMVHSHVGFFMNWQGTQHGEGFEYHILAFGLALALIAHGGGAASVDRAITRAIGRRH